MFVSQLRQALPYEGSYTQTSSRLSRNIAPASCDVKLERPVPSESLCTGRFFGKKCCAARVSAYLEQSLGLITKYSAARRIR